MDIGTEMAPPSTASVTPVIHDPAGELRRARAWCLNDVIVVCQAPEWRHVDTIHTHQK
jgi:hypothetical protein